MKLFEFIHDLSYYIEKLKKEYKSLNLYCKAIDEDSLKPAFVVADNKKFDFDYNNSNHTGLWFYFYPYYKTAKSEEDLKILVHINQIVTSKEQRGKGLAKKLIDIIITTFGEDIYAIEFDDKNPSFWNKIQSDYSHINFLAY
jgi:hypothetical protein